ncbi:MAG TPA: ergothioneine biosynthesis protein EgtC [Jatrophihabitans sp.]|nr:ergothioneine biosynthesis protein EgtC [Jatrophihabitans sp.]
MCRHLCYLGSEPILLRELLFDAEHSLARQSYAPCDMRGGGTVNADGFGAGWYASPAGPAVRYRRAGPIWQDTGFVELAAHISTTTLLAAVRNATAGMPITETAAAPFTDGHWLFSLNGRIQGWPDSVATVAGTLPTRSLLTMDAPTDAALLWALLRHRLAGATDPGVVLTELVCEVLDAAPGSRLNLLLTDGQRAYATTVTHALSVRRNPTLIASEPLDDDPAWHPVPDGRLVTADRSDVQIEPLTG